jgi:cytosine/adenosine deaminase-related metal-dependent hydrolase
VVAVENAGGDIEVFKGILSPGLINCHCHLELSHMKGRIPEKTGLVDFVFKVVTERHHSEEEILDAIDRAEKEMIQNGIVAVGDICNNNLTIPQKKQGNVYYYNFIEASGWLPAISQMRFERAKKLLDEFSLLNEPCSIVPHAPYSVSENLWKEMMPFFGGKTISIHNQESSHEDLFFLEGKGDFTKMFRMMNIDNSFYKPKKIRSVATYFKNLADAASVILVHNTFTQQEDIDFIDQNKNEDQRVSFCLCPNANMYIENTLPPVDLFLKNDLHIVLGTDSLASNHQLNILEEIKTIVKSFPETNTATLLKWATSNGAKALQMDNNLGSFEKGKTPGVILIENTDDGKITASSSVRSLLATNI